MCPEYASRDFKEQAEFMEPIYGKFDEKFKSRCESRREQPSHEAMIVIRSTPPALRYSMCRFREQQRQIL
jgi:hypothetical protein